MAFLGLELGTKSSGVSGWFCLFSENGSPEIFSCRTPGELTTAVLNSGASVLAVGSPLTAEMGPEGKLKTRAGDRNLRKLEHPDCINPRFAPLPPQLLLTRALEGRKLADEIRKIAPNLEIIETHAASSAEFLGLSPGRSGRKDRAIQPDSIRAVLPELTDPIIKTNSLALRAVLNAFTAREFHMGRTIAFGEAEKGVIHVPFPRRPKLVILDVDGTLTNVSSPWRHIHQQFGVWEGIGESILSRWLSGEISYDTFCRLDVGLWRKRETLLSEVNRILDAIEIRPGAVALLKTLSARKLKLALLSSGFTRVAQRISRLAGLEDELIVIANRLFENERGEVSVEINVSGDGHSRRSKGAHVRKLCFRLGISPVNCIGIGDGPSDRYLFERCAQSFVVRGSDDLSNLADLITQNVL